MEINNRRDFIRIFYSLAHEIQYNSAKHGFWEEGLKRNKAEMIALMHSELSEALEAMRISPTPMDEHCPQFDNLTIELADCIIRIMDFAAGFNLPLAEAILAKHDFNVTREAKHGKNF